MKYSEGSNIPNDPPSNSFNDDINKPNGQKTIHPSQVDGFLDTLPIKKFFGIGRVTAKKMKEIGIHNGGDLRKLKEL